MKKSLFLSHILAALFAGIAFTSCKDYLNGNQTLDLGGETAAMHTVTVTGTDNLVTNGELTFSEINISDGGGVTLDCMLAPFEYDDGTVSYDAVNMNGNATVNLANRTQAFDLIVSGTGNKLENGGKYAGTLTLEDGSYLTFGNLQSDLFDPAIVLGNGSTLELTSSSRRMIDGLAGIQVTGEYATIKNADLAMRNHSDYTLGNGVEKLLYDESTCYSIRGATFNLGNNTTNLDIKVHANAQYVNRIEQGRINTRVLIDSAKLMLEDVTIGNNATIEMGDYSTLTLHRGMTAENGSMISMGSGSTLNLGGETRDFAMTVTGTGNTMTNGAFLGTLTLEEGSHLKSDSAMASWDGPTSIVMKNGSTLEMVPGTGKDRWINDISALQVEGTATVVNAYLRIKPGETYTLGNGVQNLVGEGQSLLSLDNSTLDLGGGEISKLDIGVWSAFAPYSNVIKNGTVDTHVQIDPNAKLTLQGVTLGDNASFSMGANTELDIGGAEGTVWLTPDSAESIKVRNGRIGLPGAPEDAETAMVYTLSFSETDHKPTYIEGNNIRLKLEENITLATRHNTRYLVEEACIGNPNRPVYLDVKAEGHFLLGDSYNEQGAGGTKTVYGDVNVSHSGVGLSDNTGTADVDILYRLMGNLTATEMNGGAIYIGAVGYEDANGNTTKGGTVTVTGASGVSVASFIGESMRLEASGSVTLIGNARAFGTGANDSGALEIGGPVGSGPDIIFQYNLSAGTIALTGRNISGTGAYGDMSTGAAFVEFADSCTITATEAIDIKQGFKGGNLTVTGGGNVMLDLLGISEDALLAKAEIISQNNGISMRSFTGGSLSATAKETVTIGGNVTASTGNAELTGSSVSIGGSLAASSGSNNIKSTTGDISIAGTLSAQDTSTLESAANIIIEGNVTGGSLKANAGEAVTLNGDVTSTSGADLTGTSVSIQGSLAASEASANITSTTGDIEITGTLSAQVSSILNSAADITIGGNVTRGNLTATAAQSILLKDISIRTNDNDAVLTATGGSITAANFDGGSLTAKAAEAVAFSGNVASRNNATLKGASVGVNGSITTFLDRTQIESTGGDIAIGGTLSSGDSSTLDSAGDITIGTLDGDGNIISGGDVIHGALTATAANSIKLKDIIIGTNDAELTATGGSITAGAFAGANLEANAKGAVTFNGDVEASGTDEWQISTDEDAPTYAVVLEGSGVSVNGSLSADQNDVTSTGGDINITGTLNAALSSTLDSAGNITIGGNVTGGALTATAANSIQLKDISINANNAALTATNGSITAGNVTAGLLTATAAGTITLNDVAVSQSEAQIVSTGEGGNVVLNAFDGGGALIKATRGSITVATRVTGSASTNKNNFIAAGSVTFNGATGDNNLEHAIINAPRVNWSNGTTLKDVTVSHWAPPANSPLMLLAAGNGVPQATLTVNGFLELTESSTVNGNVVINKQDNIIPAVTVDHSTITGRVSGATELVLNRGRVGSVARGENETLAVASSGASAITALPDALKVDYLSLNGGSLTVCNQDETSSMGQLLVSTLTVQHNTTLDSNMEMQPGDGQESSSIIFNLSAENETTALLSMSGSLTAYAREGHGQLAGKSNISITLNGDASVEGGKRYALITLASGQKPTFWNEEKLNLAVSGLTQKTDDLFWIDGTLYFQNGGELTRAVWSPVTSHQWNTTDLNWLQDGYRYRYKDGVTMVFDDTAFQHDGYEGEVELMNNGDGFMAGDVQVENSQGHNYTFRGDGKIAETTKLTKDGDGTLTIENANSYSGGTTIHAGTLVVDNEWALGSGDVTLESGIQEEVFQAGFTPEGGTLKLSFDGQTASFGMVTLQCGTVQIANGAKSFNLTVTGKNTRLEGTRDDAFTGTLTMRVGSRLFAAGGVLSAEQRNHIDQIVMENGSTLALPAGDDANCRIWINNISVFNVYEGTDKDAPRLEGTYLCIDPGGTYTLGATTGDNINSLQNLRGDNSTAFLLDGSTLNLNRQTDRLNIIVRREQEEGESYITTGEINANVRIYNGNTLRVNNVRIGNNTSIVMDARANMIMSGVAIDAGVTFRMADEAYLDLGGTFALPTSVSLGAFTFTGASATIDNGSLYVERKETGVPLKLGTNLSGTDTVVSLHEEASLDLGGNSLAVTEVKLDTAAASATIGNGTVDSGVAVASGKALHLGNALTIAGNLSGSGTLVKDNGGTANVSGSMQGFTGSVQVQGGELNIMGIAEAASLKVADVTINSGTLGVYQGGTTGEDNEGTLTIRSSHTLAAGNGATLNANLVMERNSTLDVSATEGAGLLMGSSVTLSKGMMLNDYSADWATWKNGTKYVLFTGVDGLNISNGNGIMTGSMDYTHWVDAKEYFSNIEESNRYFLCYGGAPDQNAQGILTAVNNGSNVGMVYIMTMPEPTTSTLSLLALAALAARRRK